MGACFVGPDTCAPPDPDDAPSEDEAQNEQTVREFIESVWNYPWSPDDEAQAKQDPHYLPAAVWAAIQRLVDPDYVRHRRDGQRERKKGSGCDDFGQCVRDVHDISPDLRLEIEDLVPRGDLVMTLLVMTGTDSPAESSANGQGMLDRPSPTGRQVRAATAAVYRLDDKHRIVEDWLLADQSGLLAQLTASAA